MVWGNWLHPQPSAKQITDADFADDIALLSDTIEKTQLLLLRVELAAESIGLHINAKKTEYITYNQDEGEIITLTGNQLKCVKDFKYLGSWIGSSKKNMNTRIGLARWISSGSQAWEKNWKIKFYSKYSRKCTLVWFRKLDSYQNDGKKGCTETILDCWEKYRI